jgi:hypothetical protein
MLLPHLLSLLRNNASSDRFFDRAMALQAGRPPGALLRRIDIGRGDPGGRPASARPHPTSLIYRIGRKAGTERAKTPPFFVQAFAPRDAMRPGCCRNRSPLKTEGVGNAGCPMHPQPRARSSGSKMRTSIHSGGTGNHPAFPHAMVYSLFRALPGELSSVATVAFGLRFCPTRLSRTSLRKA